jgi:hypothetical protein
MRLGYASIQFHSGRKWNNFLGTAAAIACDNNRWPNRDATGFP